MPFADSMIRRAYQQGYALGALESQSKTAPPAPPRKFSQTDMQQAYERGWRSGRKNKRYARDRKEYQSEWFQINKERIAAMRRQQRRKALSEAALLALPAIAKHIQTAKLSDHSRSAA